DGGQDVDAKRRQADLQAPALLCEVCLVHPEISQRCAEIGQRLAYAPRIGRIGPNQDIHILGRARMAVKRNRVPTDQQELGPGVMDCNVNVSEFMQKRHESASFNMRRSRMVSRVYFGNGLPPSDKATWVNTLTSNTSCSGVYVAGSEAEVL